MESQIVSEEQCKTYCKICKNKTMQIPIRKIDSIIMIEHYCPDCKTSFYTYENCEIM